MVTVMVVVMPLGSVVGGIGNDDGDGVSGVDGGGDGGILKSSNCG